MTRGAGACLQGLQAWARGEGFRERGEDLRRGEGCRASRLPLNELVFQRWCQGIPPVLFLWKQSSLIHLHVSQDPCGSLKPQIVPAPVDPLFSLYIHTCDTCTVQAQ